MKLLLILYLRSDTDISPLKSVKEKRKLENNSILSIPSALFYHHHRSHTCVVYFVMQNIHV